MSEARAYRGVSAENRTRRRRDALLDAALDCLHAEGLSGASVRSVCLRARLTPRYFYESFAGLDELLVAVVDAVAGEVADRALAALAGAPGRLPAQVRAAIDAGYGVVADDPRKATALLVAAAGHGPLRDRRHAIVLRYADIAVTHLRRVGVTATDAQAARARALFLMGGAAELIEAVLSGSLRMSRRRVVDQLSALWLAALAADG